MPRATETPAARCCRRVWPCGLHAAVARRQHRREHQDDDRRQDRRVATSQIMPTPAEVRRVVLHIPLPFSDDFDEAVHVPDSLHRAAKAVDVTGGARHEALPAVLALGRVRNVNVTTILSAPRAWRIRTRVLGVVSDSLKRDAQAERRDREHVRCAVGIDRRRRSCR